MTFFVYLCTYLAFRVAKCTDRGLASYWVGMPTVGRQIAALFFVDEGHLVLDVPLNRTTEHEEEKKERREK
jgi:hypothetical protein